MACAICIDDQYLWVSNQRRNTLVSFAIQVGGDLASSDLERQMVETLRKSDDIGFAETGGDLILEAVFLSIGEKKFWAKCFHNVARRIFLRELGNQEIQFWQSSAIGDAYVIARMLTSAVQKDEIGWHPADENSVEAKEFYASALRIKA
jgi:hypothetical protein